MIMLSHVADFQMMWKVFQTLEANGCDAVVFKGLSLSSSQIFFSRFKCLVQKYIHTELGQDFDSDHFYLK